MQKENLILSAKHVTGTLELYETYLIAKSPLGGFFGKTVIPLKNIVDVRLENLIGRLVIELNSGKKYPYQAWAGIEEFEQMMIAIQTRV